MVTLDPSNPQMEDAGRTPAEPASGAAPASGGRATSFRAIGVVALATVAGAAVGALALYGMNRLPGNAPAAAPAAPAAQVASAADPACAPAVARAKALEPLVKGEIAALRLATEPRRLPALSFADASGKPMSLQDFEGRTVLVNLWATWCVPCRKEMPALDTLQGTLGNGSFEVVAINLDTRDPEKPKSFLGEIGVKHLRYFADPATKSFQALRSAGRGFGLPTTLIVDGKGCEIAYLAGPAEWAGPEAVALLRAAIADRRAQAR
ncbi:thiol:disulfide interchange protein TlpA [Xanthobacter pseudotagetidis]|uniref:thiol:disulfide interchange protein TlpA n=1 Tax=Xanthobacter pseudotagetidis TaxID=3119911 RepID=UPI003726BBC0